MTQTDTLHIVLLAFENANVLDIAGPLEAFSQARGMLAPQCRTPYRLVVASTRGGSIRTSSGLQIFTEPLARFEDTPIDTFLVPGIVPYGPTNTLRLPDDLVAWIASRAPKVRRVCSVCSGTLFLAAAGLLSGRRVTTHWLAAPMLRERYPDVRLDADPIFIRDGPIWTSAGVTAGIDLALALIEEDLGHRVAMQVAQVLVVFLKRPGGQSQFSVALAAQASGDGTFAELHGWIAEHLEADLRVERLAERVHMSPRTFARIYAAKVRRTPAKTVEAMRLEAARWALAETDRPLKRIANDCGFRDEQNLRRAFLRQLGVAPADYRERFSTRPETGAG